MNVVINAGEALESLDRPIRIELRLRDAAEASTYSLRVLDHGRGIGPDNLRNVFDPFFTTKERGHGLGLANAKRIMEMHGGAIDIQSTPGVGTAVELSWPQAFGAEQPVEHIEPSATSQAPRSFCLLTTKWPSLK